eukprot:CAMPEP_0113912866 /NCGR_PEP_ID=MMETSP0780_2-20120614/29185_1 /TAXON_ID=652834 /ORGANISM="Palpitomonas bilix" /LENGTH=502 /DNA_ID=CAMNT_0000909913 /DNA_START=147 /DNA_END=1655 /DNA_ORIENTATION=- /assembly_acc=CAM_ASM_000599
MLCQGSSPRSSKYTDGTKLVLSAPMFRSSLSERASRLRRLGLANIRERLEDSELNRESIRQRILSAVTRTPTVQWQSVIAKGNFHDPAAEFDTQKRAGKIAHSVVKWSQIVGLSPSAQASSLPSIAEFLHDIGMSAEASLKLFSQVEKSFLLKNLGVDFLERRVRTFLSAGFRIEEVVQLFQKKPSLCMYKDEDELRTRLDYLRETVRMSEEQVRACIMKSPMVLQYDLPKHCQARIEFLRSLFLTNEEIAKIAARSPTIIVTQSVENGLKPAVQFLSALGLSVDQIGRMVVKCPSILTFSPSEKLAPVVSFFMDEVGLTRCETAVLLSRFSTLLALSIEDNLRPKLDYLVNELKGGPSQVLKCPKYFSYSLEGRIIPRYSFLKACGVWEPDKDSSLNVVSAGTKCGGAENGKDSGNGDGKQVRASKGRRCVKNNMPYILSSTDEAFAIEVAGRTPAAFKHFKDLLTQLTLENALTGQDHDGADGVGVCGPMHSPEHFSYAP